MDINLNEISNSVKEVIRYSQNYSIDANLNYVDSIINDWYKAKQWIINKMGGKLIYEYPEEVSFELSDKEKRNKFNDFCDEVLTYWNNKKLYEFLIANEKGFFSNIVINDTIVQLKEQAIYDNKGQIIRWDSENFKILKGSKLVKSFKYFVQDENDLNKIQSKASQIIQLDKVSGILCFSVHPLDFLSISENNYNWRSCHALDGEYRTGNISYILDSSTVVCYLKSPKNVILPHFPENIPWNNKKWRVLFFFSNDENMMFAGRQYPFVTTTGIDFIKDNLIKQVGFTGVWSDWDNSFLNSFKYNHIDEESILNSKYIVVGGELEKNIQLIIEGEDCKNYNDLLHSSCYIPYYSYKLDSYHKLRDYIPYKPWGLTTSKTKFFIGKNFKCLQCGQQETWNDESFLCLNCEHEFGTEDSTLFTPCISCGRRLYEDEIIWCQDDPLCYSCADELTAYCDKCDDIFYKDDLHMVDSHSGHYCDYCIQYFEDIGE